MKPVVLKSQLHKSETSAASSTVSCMPEARPQWASGRGRLCRQCKLADADRAGLGGILRLVDYWMNQALAVRMSGTVQELHRALRPADLPDFEVGIAVCVACMQCSADHNLQQPHMAFREAMSLPDNAHSTMADRCCCPACLSPQYHLRVSMWQQDKPSSTSILCSACCWCHCRRSWLTWSVCA